VSDTRRGANLAEAQNVTLTVAAAAAAACTCRGSVCDTGR
jgi:hypothetical protein